VKFLSFRSLSACEIAKKKKKKKKKKKIKSQILHVPLLETNRKKKFAPAEKKSQLYGKIIGRYLSGKAHSRSLCKGQAHSRLPYM
jgi:hypothetical protein